MKKIIMILILSLIIIFCIDKEEKVITVFNDNSDDFYNINIIIENLNTNNFKNYFNDEIKIIGIYPKINKLYENRINSFYAFSKYNIKDNINSFIKYYKNVLKTNNFTNDLVMTDYNGIGIKKVKVYLNNSQLIEFMKKCYGCEYEKK